MSDVRYEFADAFSTGGDVDMEHAFDPAEGRRSAHPPLLGGAVTHHA